MKNFAFSPDSAIKLTFSLEYLFEFWKKSQEATWMPGVSDFAQNVLSLAERHPELAGPIENLETLDAHRENLHTLFSVLFPAATFEKDLAAVIPPFTFRPVYLTPRFASSHKKGGPDQTVRMKHEMTLNAYRLILDQMYGIRFGQAPSPVFQYEGQDGLSRFFRGEMNFDFCRVLARGPVPEMTPELHLAILDAGNDPGRLAQVLPPELFEIRGFTVLKATDVTRQEALSRLKFLLIENDSLTDQTRFKTLQELVRTILGKPDARLILGAFQDDQVMMLQEDTAWKSHCILQDSQHYKKKEFEDTLFLKAVDEGRPFAVSDLSEAHDDPLMKMMAEKGLRSVVFTPLKNGNTDVGIAMFASEEPLVMNIADADSLDEVIPLLALGLKRSVEDLERRVQSLIQEKYTSIHPSVAWKFRQTAAKLIQSGEEVSGGELEPIVFENVFPLYAVSDIRNSSSHRNDAILADLKYQLELAHKVVQSANLARKLPILDELDFRIGKQKGLLTDGLNTGDEISILNFLRREFEPLLTDVSQFNFETKKAVEAYHDKIHPEARSVYNKRKDFDDSVRAINAAISQFLDQVEGESQRMFPHYFDKNTTDGVDQNIYIGASLMPDGQFDALYLKNMKLWQFIVLCRIARLAAGLGPRLPVPLETTHLIMVQDLPITIRFRTDEKRFSVDGAYNVRYEIMKKRIDKAVVKGTGQRLTQPHQIAIVFSQADEAREYRQYIEYMQDRGWLVPGIEELELEDLQGIHGLKALRVQVNLEAPAGSSGDIKKAVEAFGKNGRKAPAKSLESVG